MEWLRLGPEEVRSLTETALTRIQSKYGNQHQPYVDGSVDLDTDRCASAIISESMEGEIQHAVRVSDLVSLTITELAAIHHSLLYP